MPKVYVTSEDPNLDYSPAYQFGSELIGVFPPGQIHLSPEVALYRAYAMLEKFEQDDFLALVGDPVKILICGIVCASKVERLKVLKWNRQSLSYLPIEINLLAPHRRQPSV